MKHLVISIVGLVVIITTVVLCKVKPFLMAKGNNTLLLENVEALSNSDAPVKEVNCYDKIHFDEGSMIVYCSDCKTHKNYTDDLLCWHSHCYRYN